MFFRFTYVHLRICLVSSKLRARPTCNLFQLRTHPGLTEFRRQKEAEQKPSLMHAFEARSTGEDTEKHKFLRMHGLMTW